MPSGCLGCLSRGVCGGCVEAVEVLQRCLARVCRRGVVVLRVWCVPVQGGGLRLCVVGAEDGEC